MLTVGIEFITTENKYRGVSGGWAGWAIANPCFGKSSSQMSTQGISKREMGTYDFRSSRF